MPGGCIAVSVYCTHTVYSRRPSAASLAGHANSWKVPPGQTGTNIDAVMLNDWVDRARSEVAPLGRGETGDRLMGAVMSGPAPDTDGVWPRIPIRDLTERLASDDFEQGLVMGRYNGRGVISRDPFAGGELERGEAEAYERMATTTATRWPLTSAMLRRMARHAHADAAVRIPSLNYSRTSLNRRSQTEGAYCWRFEPQRSESVNAAGADEVFVGVAKKIVGNVGAVEFAAGEVVLQLDQLRAR
jgi:hypothetical protein